MSVRNPDNYVTAASCAATLREIADGLEENHKYTMVWATLNLHFRTADEVRAAAERIRLKAAARREVPA